MIQAKELSKSYRNTPVFTGLSFAVRPGQFVAIRGESGSGKTTLLNLVAGLDQADQGSLQVSGVELCGKTKNQLVEFRRDHLSMIFQDFHLISSLSALENLVLPVRLAGRPVDRDRLVGWLDQVGMAGKQNKLPQELSGGEQQRVAIARALAMQPQLLLADEPTGNLDQDNGVKVMELLSALRQELNLTVVMVTHSDKAASYADQSFLMESRTWR